MNAPGRLLVVNADDAGVDADRDAAILDAFDRGVVRSASVVANGETAAPFVLEAQKRIGLSLGLHVNLTSGKALALARAFTLLGSAGQFVGDKHEVWRRAVEGHIDPREVSREVLAQWRRLESLGAKLDHVDSRDHVHVLPNIADGVLDALAMVRGHVFVRVPDEGDPPPGSPHVTAPAIPVGTSVFAARRASQLRAGHTGIATLGIHADVLRRRVVAPLRATDAFLGLALSLSPTLPLLEASLRSVRGPVVEWSVRPERASANTGTGSPAPRVEEFRLLTEPATRAAIETAGLRIGSFADANA